MKSVKKYFYEKIQKVTVTELSIVPLIFMIADTTALLLQKQNREITQTALIISIICFFVVLFLKNRIGITPYDEAQDELRRLVRKKGTLVKRMSFDDSFIACKGPNGYKKNLGAVIIKNLWGDITSVYVVFEDHEGNIKYYDYPQQIKNNIDYTIATYKGISGMPLDDSKNPYLLPYEPVSTGKTLCINDKLKPCLCGSNVQPVLVYSKEGGMPFNNVIVVCSECGRHTENPDYIKKAIEKWNEDMVVEE